jgi:uncharacterized membrane protein YjdF
LLTWWLEAAPLLIALLFLAATRRRFPLSALLSALLLLSRAHDRSMEGLSPK